nr:hypothetical protein [Pseudomonadota bacterium]
MADKETGKKDEDKDDGKGAEGAEAPEGEGTKKGLNKKLVIIGGGAFVFLLAAGGAGFFFMHGKSDEPKSAEATAAAAKADAASAEAKTVYFSLGDLLVNLSGEGKHPNFLKVKISLELADEKDAALMESIKPRII